MLELPGLTNTGNVQKDLDTIRRYLSKLVPQLEMELMNAQQDGYSNAMSALSQGIGAVNTGTTAGALAAHELRKDNPHGVTLSQLGFSMDRFVRYALTEDGAAVWIGEKRGFQLSVMDLEVNIPSWTQRGGVSYAETGQLGEWDHPIPLLLWAGVTVRGGQTERDYWAGPLTGATGTQIGAARLYHECGINIQNEQAVEGTVEEPRTINLSVIGVGVFGYGE